MKSRTGVLSSSEFGVEASHYSKASSRAGGDSDEDDDNDADGSQKESPNFVTSLKGKAVKAGRGGARGSARRGSARGGQDMLKNASSQSLASSNGGNSRRPSIAESSDAAQQFSMQPSSSAVMAALSSPAGTGASGVLAMSTISAGATAVPSSSNMVSMSEHRKIVAELAQEKLRYAAMQNELVVLEAQRNLAQERVEEAAKKVIS